MKAKNIKLFFVNGRETLKRTTTVKFVERIVTALHATIEKIAGIRSLAVVG